MVEMRHLLLPEFGNLADPCILIDSFSDIDRLVLLVSFESVGHHTVVAVHLILQTQHVTKGLTNHDLALLVTMLKGLKSLSAHILDKS